MRLSRLPPLRFRLSLPRRPLFTQDTCRLQFDLEGLHVLLMLFGIGLVIWVGAQAMWSVEFHGFLMGGTVLFAIDMESCIVGRRSE